MARLAEHVGHQSHSGFGTFRTVDRLGAPLAPHGAADSVRRANGMLMNGASASRMIQPLTRRTDSAARAPSSRTTPPGGRPGTIETMKETDNRSATASPRGGVESSVVGTRTTATQVNTIRRRIRTSLRAIGEVGLPDCSGSVAHVPGHGGACVVSGVVGGSRSGRGCVREDGRPAGAGRRKRFPAGVRAAIRVQANRGKSSAGKSGTTDRSRVTTGGAKGGRKVERRKP